MSIKIVDEKNYRRLLGVLMAERRYKNIKQTELAELLGFASHTSVSKIENFEKTLSLPEFIGYAKAVGLDPHECLDILLSPRPNIF